MIKRFIHLSLLTLLFSYASHGQKLKRYDDLLLFKDAQSQQPIIIINDSLVYKGKQLIPFKHTEYPDKISEYLPFEIGKKTYLVHQACGPVLEFRNDSIVRIDNSFLKKTSIIPYLLPITMRSISLVVMVCLRIKTSLHVMILKAANGIKYKPEERHFLNQGL